MHVFPLFYDNSHKLRYIIQSTQASDKVVLNFIEIHIILLFPARLIGNDCVHFCHLGCNNKVQISL